MRFGSLLRVAAVAIHAMTWTLPANAYYLNRNPAVGSDAANGKTPQTAWRTVAYANSHLPADSTQYVAASDTLYDEEINPTHDGTIWIGDSTNFRSVRIPGASLAHPNGTFIGLSFEGGITCRDADFQWSEKINGRSNLFRKCGLYGFNSINSSQNAIYNCEIGSSNVAINTQLYVTPVKSHGDSIVLVNNTMWLRNPNIVPGDYLLQFQPLRPDKNDYTTMRHWFVSGNRCTLTTTYGQHLDKSGFFGRIADSNISNNSFLWRDSTNLSGIASCQAFVCRDSFNRNVMSADTIELRTLFQGRGEASSQIYSVGSFKPDSGNVWKDCVFKNNLRVQAAPSPFAFQWQVGGNDSILRCQFISNASGPTCTMFTVKPGDSCHVRNNLFANLAGGRCLEFGPNSPTCSWNAGGTMVLDGNVFYGPRSTDGALLIDYKSGYASGVASDYNLFWTPLAQSRAEFQGQCGGLIVPVPVGTGNFDAHSTYGCPVFADSSFDTFDATMGCNSAAHSNGLWGSDAGPVAYDSTLCAPSPVTDLRVVGTTANRAYVMWTAPGDLGDTGQSQLYKMAYSTSAITAGNFASADTVAAPGVIYPRSAGETERATLSGLTASTTYYVALKALGSAGVYSGISNVISFTTRPSNTKGGQIDP